jgi:hypothetical protein
MYIEIRGEAKVRKADYDQWTEYQDDDDWYDVVGRELAQFHGLSAHNPIDEFSQWLNHGDDLSLVGLVRSGWMHFEYDAESEQLITVTRYAVNRELTGRELGLLMSYTQGQWSDGIGEGYEQRAVRDGYYISPWHYKQELSYQYIVPSSH